MITVDPQQDDQVARDIHTIRNWVIFFGVVAVLGMVLAIVGVVVVAHAVSTTSSTTTTSCDLTNPNYPNC
jgi:hypothetical protein